MLWNMSLKEKWVMFSVLSFLIICLTGPVAALQRGSERQRVHVHVEELVHDSS